MSGIHWPVLAFTLSLATGFAMGLYPAWQSSGADLVDGLKDAGRSMSGSRGQHRFRRGLVSAQVGLSVVLLAGAATLISSFVRLSRTQAGFSGDHVWTAGIGLPLASYADDAARVRFADRLANELKTAPSIETAAVGSSVPFIDNNTSSPYTIHKGSGRTSDDARGFSEPSISRFFPVGLSTSTTPPVRRW